MNRALNLVLRKTPVLFKNSVKPASITLNHVSKRFYWPEDQLMKREEGDYYNDPKAVAEVVVRMIGLHDNVSDPSKVTLNSTFEELGLNELDMVEINLMLEQHYGAEIADET